MPGNGTFSETWYRISGRRIALRPHIRLTRQMFRGERWHVLHDPFGHQYFRLRPAAYEFVARLTGRRTVQEVWDECLRRFPDDAPGQSEVIRLLAQLFHANLIQSDAPADSAALFERHRRRRRRETGARLLNIMFARFHLLDPDRFLMRAMPLVRPLLGPAGLALWVAAVVLGAKAMADHWSEFRGQAQGVLAPGNLPLLYAGLVLVKTLHEFGHAFLCRRFGGEVHDMGVMLLIFTPLPYVNATASWAFRERWKRVLVGLGGVLTELFVAAVAAVVWASVAPGVLRSLAYNMVFVASVSTIVFNANPLLRYDGYYVLADLLDQPNLHARAAGVWRHWIERRLFGMRADVAAENPAVSPGEAAGLALFAAMSAAYRVVVFGGILLVVGSRFLLVGAAMAAVCAAAWIVTPAVRLARYLAADPRLRGVRARAAAAAISAVAAAAALVGAIPFPSSVVAPGMVRMRQHTIVAADTAGALAEILAPPGARVEAGAPLVRLAAPELEFALAAVRAQIDEVEARLRQAMETSPANLTPLRSAQQVAQRRLEDLEERRAALRVCARHAGIWSAPGLTAQMGAWFARGAPVGVLVDPDEPLFDAVIGQTDASRVFGERPRSASVRLRGEAAVDIPMPSFDVIGGDHTVLPGMALGWMGGGEVAVDPRDSSGLRTAEPFFELRGRLPADAPAAMAHGRTGRVRFVFEPEPLGRQWARKLRQLIQQRYQL